MGASSSSGDKGGLEVDPDALVTRVLRALPDPVLVCKAGGRIVLANPAVHALLGYDDGALVGRKVGKILPEDFRDPDRAPDADADEEMPADAVPARRRDGGLVPVAVSLATIPGIGRPLSVAVLRLLGEAEEEDEGAEEEAAGGGPTADEAALVDERDAEIEQLRTLLARARDELQAGRAQLDATRSELDRTRADLAATERDLTSARTSLSEIRAGRDRTATELAVAREQLEMLTNDLDVVRADLAHARAAAAGPPASFEHDLYDPLTELPRRPLLHDNLERALAQAARSGGVAGVLMVDLDRFGELDHAYGSAITEQLLTDVATRLVGTVGPDDVLARMRTEELAVLHTSTGDGVSGFTDLAARIAHALDEPFLVGDVALKVTASIGISVGSVDTTAEEVLREADVAVGRAKSNGGDRAELFDQDLRLQARRRLDQAAALRRAIDDEELLVLWQAAHPLQASDTPSEPWAEALVRWHNPERGLVSASNFIQLAEETGLIVPIGRFVIESACRQLATWRAEGGRRPTRASVNLSPRELARDDLVDAVASVLAETGIEADALILEITESVVATGTDDAVRRLEQLHELGVGLAMDDFGTGESSLGVLRRLPVSVLKVDRAFVSGLTSSKADWAIVRGLIEIGHSLGLTVVAEGIETVEQLDALVELGCDRGQGYLWSSPVPVTELEAQLEAQPADAG